VTKQGIVLKHETHAAIAGIRCGRVLAVQMNGAAVWKIEAGDHTE